ncbi:Cytotoxic T-lymphocyte protein 4, partial [Dissostichus eleginoides]
SGKICGNTLQKSFLEWTYAKFEWSAARETANKSASKLDEEGVEVAVCRHGHMFEVHVVAVRTDMLTIQASGWNKRKAANLEQTLARRYMKTVQRITEATEDLEKLTAELSLKDNQTTGTPSQNDLQKTIEGLYLSIKQQKCQLYRQSGGNKRRHKLRKKIAEEKKALEDAITEHTAVVGEADKLPPPNELLAEDNYSWKWECHGDMVQKQKVYDKVMLLTRLKEEAVILVHEVKKHWEYMRSVAGKIDHLSSQLSEGITGQSSTEALTERGHEGLLSNGVSEEQPSDSSSSTDEEL